MSLWLEVCVNGLAVGSAAKSVSARCDQSLFCKPDLHKHQLKAKSLQYCIHTSEHPPEQKSSQLLGQTANKNTAAKEVT